MWFMIALILGAGLVGYVMWLRSRKIKVAWYEWIIGVLGILLLLFAIQNSLASVAENEPRAAWTFLWVLGVPAVVLLSIASFLPWLRRCRHVKISPIAELKK